MAIASNFPAIRPSLNLDFANARALDPRITFSRASAATYYDGKTVAKAEENLFLSSQDFAGGNWGKNLVIFSDSGVAAPDGTATVKKCAGGLGSGYQYFHQSVSVISESAVATLSFFAKAGEYTKAQVANQSSGNINARFDLSAGTVISTAGTLLVSASITPVGNGWFRCVVSFYRTGPVVATISAYPDTATLSMYAPQYTGDGVSGAYFWGAQLEQRSQVTAYTPTTTQPITNYIPVLQTAPAGVPRFDHNPVTGESLGLLVEEQRTNLLTYSEQFDSGSWGKANIAVEHNAAIAPDGTLTSDKLVPATSNTTHTLSKSYTSSSGTYTASLYVKPAGYHRLRFYLNDSVTGDSYAIVNFATETITGSGVNGSWTNNSSTLTKLANGWFRVSVTGTQGAGSSVSLIALVMNNEGSGTFTGDGYSGIYIWGAQLEAGTFPTSYIKTEASQVTRAADSASMTGANFSSWYRQDEGTLCSDLAFSRVTGAQGGSVAAISDSSSGVAGSVVIYAAQASQTVAVFTSGAQQASLSFPLVSSNNSKFSASYAFNEVKGSCNGLATQADSSALVPSVNSLLIGRWGGNPGYLNGAVKRITYYPKRLTDAQLQALTA